MKTLLRLISNVRGCRTAVLFFLLTISLPAFAQAVIDPIIGPMVRIISPPNHAVFFAPVDLPIFAYVVDSPTTNVEFYANTNDLGHGFSLGASNRPPGTLLPDFVLPIEPILRLGSIYCLVWSNAPPGSYALTAVTKEGSGITTSNVYDPPNDYDYLARTSAPVNITILPQIPVTNGPAVASIVATDPIAIVGSNSWIWPGPTNPVPVWTNWPPPVTVPCTNWGPKNALFTVRRFCNETNAITVTYKIGGTAGNGVDYIELPATVTFPTNKAYALIPVVPIDNGPPYMPRTVILTLAPDTNVPPKYVIGIPSHATAVILHEWLRPLPLLLPDGGFHLNAAGPDGAWFTIESSPDLLNWSPVCTNQVVQGSIDFVDVGISNNIQQFYQAVPQGNAPSE